MASRRKGWSELSPAYRGRLERGGLTRQQYEAGQSLSSARGHGATPERKSGWITRAENFGIGFVAAEWDEFKDAMTDEERIEIARNYVRGFMTPGKATDARILSRKNFIGFVVDLRGGTLDRDEWRAFRALYLQHFGSKTA